MPRIERNIARNDRRGEEGEEGAACSPSERRGHRCVIIGGVDSQRPSGADVDIG